MALRSAKYPEYAPWERSWELFCLAAFFIAIAWFAWKRRSAFAEE